MSHQNNQSPAHDFFDNLLNTPLPSPANSSSNPQTSHPTPSNAASPSGFAAFNVNPFSQPFYSQPGQSAVPPQFYNPQHYQQFHQQFFQHSQNTIPPIPETPPHQFHEGSPSVASADVDVEATENRDTSKKRKQIRWSDHEAKVLAQRWISASENPIQGNSQTEDFFWNSIVVSYNSCVDVKRNKNQLTGKWNKIRHDVRLFGSIFKKYSEQRRQSGADDKAVYDAAREHFKEQTSRNFVYESCWHELKDYPKFWVDHGVIISNRRPREDPINLEDDDAPPGYPEPNPRMEALFQDDPIRRPPGRDVSRKSQKSRSSSDATSSRHSSEECKAEYVETQRAHRRTLKTIEESTRQKEVFEAFKVINLPIDESLPEREKKRMLKYKKMLWKKYENEFPNMSDEDEE